MLSCHCYKLLLPKKRRRGQHYSKRSQRWILRKTECEYFLNQVVILINKNYKCLQLPYATIRIRHPDKLNTNNGTMSLISGGSATLINKRSVRHWKETKDTSITWVLKQVTLKPKDNVKTNFACSAVHENRYINCNAYVDQSHIKSCNKDMIIGSNLMYSMGIKSLFDTAETFMG